MKKSRRKALLVASHGGHWVQLRRLASAFDGYEVSYVCTTACVAAEIGSSRLHVVPDANLQVPWQLLPLALRLLWIVFRERPAVVLSTGAAPGFFALFFGKLCRARTVWVDSLANAEQLSVSGRKVKPFADLWLTQWPHLEGPNGPYYRGAVL